MKAIVYDWHTDIYPTNDEVKELCLPGHGAFTCKWLTMAPEGWNCIYMNRSGVDTSKLTAQRDGCDRVRAFNPMGKEGEVEVP